MLDIANKGGKVKSNTSSWIGTAAGAATGIMGLIGSKKREQRQMDNQKELMQKQYENQRALNEQGYANQMQYWKDTNAPAQMAMLKKAGLNAGLMYGQGGAGGSTGAGSGGSAASGSAPQAQPIAMDISSIVSAVKAVAELGKMKAEKTNTETNTASTKEDVVRKGMENEVEGAGLDEKVEGRKIEAYHERRKAQSDLDVQQGGHKDGKEWANGRKITRYEQAEMDKLEGVGIDNLVKKASEGLSKATASNLISNDEMIGLQTDILRAQTGIINSETFKKLPIELQAVLLMVVKKFGGM